VSTAVATPAGSASPNALRTAPDIALACEPARSLARLGQLAPDNMIAKRLGGDPVTDVLALLLTAPDDARRLGVNADGPIRFSASAHGGELSIPVEAAGPGALLEQLGATLQHDGVVTSGDEIMGRYEPGRLILGHGTRPDTEALSTLTAGLPHAPGCTIAVSQPEKELRLAAHIPATADAPVVLRVSTPKPPPAVMAAPTGAPVGGSSHAHPMVVGVLGVSPSVLLRDPQVATAMKLSEEDRQQVLAMTETLDVGAGITVALYMSSGGVDAAMVVPLQRPGGQPLRIRRMVRIATKMVEAEGGRATRLGRNGLRADMKKKSWTLVFSKDRLYAGTQGDAVLEAASGSGSPWVNPRLATLAAQQTVALVVDTKGMLPGAPEIRIEGGLRAVDEVWEVQFLVEGTPEMLQMLTAAFGGAMKAASDRKK
jgi:hypothetical protein